MAAMRRNDPCRQHRCECRGPFEGAVRVPELIGASRQRLAMCFGYETTVLGDIVQTRIERTGTDRPDLHKLQGPERAGEGHLQVVADRLAPKQENAVLLECRAHRLIGLVTCRDVDQGEATYLNAKVGSERNQFHRLGSKDEG